MLSKLELSIDNTSIRLETGRIARQAGAAVVVEHHGSFVLGTVTCNHGPSTADFLPLTVDYREKMASRGRIPGNFFRRETRAGEHETLTSRLIDRSLRPLFPSGFNKETVVTVTVYSADERSDLAGLAIIAASTALLLSDVPFDGPVLGGTLQLRDGHAHLFPDKVQDIAIDFDLVVSFSPNGLVMMEGDSIQGTEAQLTTLLGDAANLLAPVFSQLERWREDVGKTKVEFQTPEFPDEATAQVKDSIADALNDALDLTDKKARRHAFDHLVTAALEHVSDYPADLISDLINREIKQTARRRILSGKRADGRTLDTVRNIECEVGLLAHNHGSALFTRGETQALVSATLGSQREGQDMESLSGMVKRGFMLHYNFPGFSVGETRRPSGPGRREIGHGSLARRALLGVMPTQDSWPYTTRIVSDITESNGSSSMATVCGASLAMMDAGVTLPNPVAGIAMGLIKEGKDFSVLSDILGDEDHLGDMDFKVAGTENGITSLQMDIKITSITKEIMEIALEQARDGRLHILKEMSKAISVSRKNLAETAPKIFTMSVAVEKIRDIIGSGGKVIREICEVSGAKVDIDDDGSVTLSASDGNSIEKAKKMIYDIIAEPELGLIYKGKVVKTVDFGAFVNFLGARDGLVHISELQNERTEKTTDICKEGDEVQVKVIGFDDRGKVKLSMKRVDQKTGKDLEKD